MQTLWQDLRYAVRMLARNPGFTAVAVLTLAAGIGANTAIFSVIDAVLLKMLPVRNPQQLVVVRANHGTQPRDFSYPIFSELARRQDVLDGILAAGSVGILRASVEGFGELSDRAIVGRLVSGNYFTLLGVRPLLGRVLADEDDQVPGLGGPDGPVAVISHGFWERQFARDPSVVGRTITLNGAAFTIVGVTPREFFGDSLGMTTDIWMPMRMQPRLMPRDLLPVHTATWFRTMGRLKPGVSEEQAKAALATLYRRLLADEIAAGKGSRIHRPPRLDDVSVALEPGGGGFAGLRLRLSRPLQLLMGVVGLVLLIACCNVANLLLARAASRQREIAIRFALGSGRGRLIRQLLTESVLLATAGGALGLLFAAWGIDLLLALFSVPLDLGPDWRALSFTLAVSLLAGMLFGLAPALQATADGNPALQRRGGRPQQRLARALVISQVALSIVLLVGAGLLIRTLQNLRALDAGFDRDHVLLITVSPDPSAKAPAEPAVLGAQVLHQLQTVPGVRSASLSGYALMSGSAQTAPVRVPDSKVNPQTDGEVRQNQVSPGYFDTLGMRLLLGRGFGPQDTASSQKVAVINETMARHYFGEQSPLGKYIYFPKVDPEGRYIPFGREPDREQAIEIVGVVQDAKYDNLRQKTPRLAYLPWSQGSGRLSSVEVRTAGNLPGIASEIRQALKQVSDDLIIRNVVTMEEQVNRTMAEERLISRLLSFFGVLALLLASVGLYGVMCCFVARRTHEIGIRMALGAPRASVLRMVLGETMTLLVVGLVLGVPAALASSRLVSSFLFGLTPTDPLTILTSAALLAAVAAMAGFLPARRASRVDPMVALRYE